METILNEDITLDERIEKFKNIPYLTSSLIQKVRERKIKMSPYLLYSPPFNTFLCDLYNTLQQKEKTEEFRKLYEQYIQLDTLKWEHLETLQKYYNNNDTVKDYIILEYKFFEQEYEKIKNKK
ncbi:MAG: hypothetical protein LBP53_07265 [Candidatus Peribacteria bacterium]|jgi:hypothetical protein|nr:hypothetical protein [Candidatus Peribacteria bacterium]